MAKEGYTTWHNQKTPKRIARENPMFPPRGDDPGLAALPFVAIGGLAVLAGSVLSDLFGGNNTPAYTPQPSQSSYDEDEDDYDDDEDFDDDWDDDDDDDWDDDDDDD